MSREIILFIEVLGIAICLSAAIVSFLQDFGK